jgi:hypothetical protein
MHDGRMERMAAVTKAWPSTVRGEHRQAQDRERTTASNA